MAGLRCPSHGRLRQSHYQNRPSAEGRSKWLTLLRKKLSFSIPNRFIPALPDLLQPLQSWCRDSIDDRLNGLLVIWYDGSRGHYIGKHRDSTMHMVDGAPIVTISFGEQRTFRLKPWKTNERQDFVADHGKVFVMPYDTNLNWTHEVPKTAAAKGRRISVTLRAFTH